MEIRARSRGVDFDSSIVVRPRARHFGTEARSVGVRPKGCSEAAAVVGIAEHVHSYEFIIRMNSQETR